MVEVFGKWSEDLEQAFLSAVGDVSDD